MNDHSKDLQTRYLRETAIALAREGFQTDRTDTGKLRILLDGAPLCEVTENGGITYRNEDINELERVAAKDKVYEIARTTAEYMRQMETAPDLKADGLEDGYKVLADFNGTVLAGVQSKHGVHFVTWDWAYGHTGVCHSLCFLDNHCNYSFFRVLLMADTTITCCLYRLFLLNLGQSGAVLDQHGAVYGIYPVYRAWQAANRAWQAANRARQLSKPRRSASSAQRTPLSLMDTSFSVGK